MSLNARETGLQTGENPYKKEYEHIGRGLDHLAAEGAKSPEQRSQEVVVGAELIMDVFLRGKAKPGRESAREIKSNGHVSVNLGGGGNVVESVHPFAKNVQVITRIGGREFLAGENETLFQILGELPPHVSTSAIVDPISRNAVKIRPEDQFGNVIGDAYVIDPEIISPFAEGEVIEAMDRILQKMKGDEQIIVSDYGRGLWTPNIMRAMSERFGSNGFQTLTDPRPGPDMFKYNIEGAIIKPNREELEKLTDTKIPDADQGDFHRALDSAAEIMFSRYPKIGALFATCDKDGAAYYAKDKNPVYVPLLVKPNQVVNPSGAGDITASTFMLLNRNKNFAVADSVATALALASTSVAHGETSKLDMNLIREVQAKISK